MDAAPDGGVLSAGLADRIETALGARPAALVPLSGGCIADDVVRLEMPDGRRLVAKSGIVGHRGASDAPAATLADEAAMLRDLRRLAPGLPFPEVLHVESTLLIMEWLPGSAGAGPAAETHLADLLAELHAVRGPYFGFERPTPVGPLMMPNTPGPDWPRFYACHRLLVFGNLAFGAGRLAPDAFARLERLCARLGDWLPADRPPALIHGDLWSGNILSDGARITGLIDPAMFYADPELELGFMTVFGGPGARFFARYRERRGLDAEFEATRKPLYQLDGLIAHAWFFGGGYGAQADRILRRYVG